MTRARARAVGIVVAVLLARPVLETAARMLLWHSHWQPGLDVLRRYNKRVMSRATLRRAGRRGASTTAVRHVGRTTGRPYVTPVWAVRSGGSFLIQLPYGTHVDWCRNVLAAGGCTLEHDGARYETVRPAIVPAAVAHPLLPRGTRVAQRLMVGADHYLRLDLADEHADLVPEPAAA